jgi:hypothetical protein
MTEDNDLVERLRAAAKHPLMDNSCIADVFDVSDAADRIEALTEQLEAARLDAKKAVEEKLDAISKLDAWFDRRKLGHKAVDQAIVDAASGYLRICRVGGMDFGESDRILAAIQDMAQLSLFADLFARATLAEIEGAEAMTDDTPARLRILARAAEVTGGERQDSYGPVKMNLQRIADLWTTYLDREVVITAEDAAWMMVLLKMARSNNGWPYHEDNYIDAAAYAAIAGECRKP